VPRAARVRPSHVGGRVDRSSRFRRLSRHFVVKERSAINMCPQQVTMFSQHASTLFHIPIMVWHFVSDTMGPATTLIHSREGLRTPYYSHCPCGKLGCNQYSRTAMIPVCDDTNVIKYLKPPSIDQYVMKDICARTDGSMCLNRWVFDLFTRIICGKRTKPRALADVEEQNIPLVHTYT